MLLKITAQIKWSGALSDKKDETIFMKFMEILNFITTLDVKQSEEDKSRTYWEKALIESWERLLDIEEEKNYEFFVVKENLLKEIKQLADKASEKLLND